MLACHAGEPGKILGFSAVQQPALSAALLSVPLARAFRPPGDARARAALGYLHANCGHCHDQNGSARPDTDLALRLSVNDVSVERTAAYRTSVGRSLDSFSTAAFDVRVRAGRPEESALLFRLAERNVEARMPPLGSERVDPAGVRALRAWIESL